MIHNDEMAASKPRPKARRTILLIGGVAIAAIVLMWVIVGLLVATRT
jgi:hypothetical protein